MHKVVALASAGLSAVQGSHAALQPDALVSLAARDGVHATTFAAPVNVGVDNIYASHRSHSSHSSHRSHSSHSSHYSGSGARYVAPPASYAPPSPPPPPAPHTRAPDSQPPETYVPAPGRSFPASPGAATNVKPNRERPPPDRLRLMVMRVQAALFARGYDPGAIDGVLGPSTRDALQQFQSAHGLIISGTISTDTLNALGVPFN